MDKSLSIKISLDGNQWCVLAGEDLQEGFAGFGNTKEEAWHALGKELFGVPCVCQDCTCDGCKRSTEVAALLEHPSHPAIPKDVRKVLNVALNDIDPRHIRHNADYTNYKATLDWLAQCPTATDKAVCPQCGYECPIYLDPGAEDDVMCPVCRHRYGIRTLPLVVISPPREPKDGTP